MSWSWLVFSECWIVQRCQYFLSINYYRCGCRSSRRGNFWWIIKFDDLSTTHRIRWLVQNNNSKLSRRKSFDELFFRSIGHEGLRGALTPRLTCTRGIISPFPVSLSVSGLTQLSAAAIAIFFTHLKQDGVNKPFVCDWCFSSTLGTLGISSGHLSSLLF